MRNKTLLILALTLAMGAMTLLGAGSAQATGGTPLAQTIVLGSGSAAALMVAAGDLAGVVNPTTAEQYTGNGSWQANLSAGKLEFYIAPTTPPFDSLGAFRVKDIASVSYHTKKGTPATAVDFALEIYTAKDASCSTPADSWYCHRLTAEPYLSANLNAPASTWNTWSSNAGANQLRFYDAKRTVSGWFNEPTLQNLQAGPLNWANYSGSGSSAVVDYSNENVGSIKISDSTSWASFSGYLDAITINLKSGNSLTTDLEGSTLTFQPGAAYVADGSTIPININLDAVSNLFGYQFKVHFDSTKVSASGVFVNTIFDTSSNAFITWNADCTTTPGVCEFAVTKERADGVNPVDVNGTIATITFTANNPGTVPLTFSDDILSDRDAHPLPHSSYSGTLNVYGFATVNGAVNLQGRTAPFDTSGTVTLTDQGGNFSPTVVNPLPNGTFSASVPVLPGGSTYNLLANHSLYLSNQLTGLSAYTPGNTYTPAATKLLGGDANNSGTINIDDLTCIGGSFGGAPVACSGGGSPDITADSTVNILDLVLAGGNYGLSSPQGW